MDRTRICPDTTTYNACISACEKAAEWQVALATLAEMEDRRLRPDTISYSARASHITCTFGAASGCSAPRNKCVL